jgi:hypothetical protein
MVGGVTVCVMQMREERRRERRESREKVLYYVGGGIFGKFFVGGGGVWTHCDGRDAMVETFVDDDGRNLRK